MRSEIEAMNAWLLLPLLSATPHRTGAESVLSNIQTAQANRGMYAARMRYLSPGFCVRLRRCLGWKRLLTTPSRMIVTAATAVAMPA